MYLYNFLFENRNALKLLYTIIICIICFLIVAKTHKLFKLSFHQGIRYFRNSFLFYGLAFLTRYLLVSLYDVEKFNISALDYSYVVKFIFDFFLIMAGFFLLYSLLWRRFEGEEGSRSSLFNSKIFIFYILSAIIAMLDIIWTTSYFMFLSQVIVFSFAAGICFEKYEESKKEGKASKFLNLYLMVIVLNFLLWMTNFVVSTSFDFVIASGFDWRRAGVIISYGLQIIIFSLFLYSILKSTKKA